MESIVAPLEQAITKHKALIYIFYIILTTLSIYSLFKRARPARWNTSDTPHTSIIEVLTGAVNNAHLCQRILICEDSEGHAASLVVTQSSALLDGADIVEDLQHVVLGSPTLATDGAVTLRRPGHAVI